MKLLVNNPQGFQELVSVSTGGGYFDASRVVWDERVDGELPEITLGGMIRDGDELLYSQEEFDAQTFPSLVPQSVTMAQARKAIILSGIGEATVDAAIAAIEDTTQRDLALADWNYSGTVRRDSALVASLAPGLNLGDSELDQLFILADSQ